MKRAGRVKSCEGYIPSAADGRRYPVEFMRNVELKVVRLLAMMKRIDVVKRELVNDWGCERP